MKYKTMIGMAMVGSLLVTGNVWANEIEPGTIIPLRESQNYVTRSIPYSEQITEADGDYVAYFNVDHSFRFYIRNDCDSDIYFKCYTDEGKEVGLPQDTVAPGKGYTSMWVASGANSTYHISMRTVDGGDLDAFLRVRESDI